MPRRHPLFDRARHRTPLPPERRAELPFIYDPESRTVLAPWPRNGRALPSDDQARLDRVAERIASLDPMPQALMWIWPDPGRGPVAIEGGSRSWVMHQARDRARYAVTFTR